MTPSQHFGYASDMTEYETTGHVLFVNLEFYPVKNLDLHLNGNYTMAEGSFSSINMVLPHEVVHHGDYDYSEIHTYSDLDQSYFEIDAGGNVALSENLGLYANVKYMDYTDDQPYVYGDYSGDWFDFSLGATISL